MKRSKGNILFKRIIAIIALVAILPLVSALNLFNAHAEENVESITANKANIDIFNDEDFVDLGKNVAIMPQDAKQDVRFICSDDSLLFIADDWGFLNPTKTGTVTITAIATNGTDDDESDDKTTTFTVTIKEKEEISYVVFDSYSNCYVEEKTKNYNMLTQDNQEWSRWDINVVTEDIEYDSEIIL